MKENKAISGFSKLTRDEKVAWLRGQIELDDSMAGLMASFEPARSEWREIIAGLSENYLTSFHLPFGLAPNFLINGSMKVFPLVTEESSVVAAMAKAASFWARRGGFHTDIIGVEKKGQLHFEWKGDPSLLRRLFPEIRAALLNEVAPFSGKMTRRGGGILHMELKYLPEILPGYYQIDVAFDTKDAMGANFINSCLEQFGRSLKQFMEQRSALPEADRQVDVIMAILSNYVPDNRVKVWVECPVSELSEAGDAMTADHFAGRFVRAVTIAQKDVSRAVTHNKGIFNGIDALALATGNDFRAIEAGGHAYASRTGQYAGLSEAKAEAGKFRFSMELPLAVGIVGGVTTVHPLAKLAMQILENPDARELMQYMAAAGLASNWSALRALVSEGIQKGHMKMHLGNILNSLGATDEQKQSAGLYFQNREVSFAEVEHYLKNYAGR